MEELLDKYGFKPGDDINEYLKGNWTIRFFDDSIEAFNNPDMETGVYFIGLREEKILKVLLEDITVIKK